MLRTDAIYRIGPESGIVVVVPYRYEKSWQKGREPSFAQCSTGSFEVAGLGMGR
jgi:hypothetical protein